MIDGRKKGEEEGKADATHDHPTCLVLLPLLDAFDISLFLLPFLRQHLELHPALGTATLQANGWVHGNVARGE